MLRPVHHQQQETGLLAPPRREGLLPGLRMTARLSDAPATAVQNGVPARQRRVHGHTQA